MNLCNVPVKIVAGTTVKFSRSFSNYPTDAWTYTFYLAGPGPFSKEATVEDEQFQIELTAAETAELKAGGYRYVERVEKDGEVYEVGSGTVEVGADLATTEAGDQRSFARKMRDGLRARLENMAGDGASGKAFEVQSFQIAGRSVVYRTHAEMLVAYDRFNEEVRQEEAAERISKGMGTDPRNVGIRFRHA